jgi:hypothetical protein
MAEAKPKRRGWRWAIRLVVWPLLLYVMLRWFEYRQVYWPSARLEAAGSALGRPWEEVFFTARDGVKLHGWFFRADPNAPRAHLALHFSHGNAGNISHRLDLYALLLDLGLSVFAYDYRGYGRSEGRPGEEGTYRDAEAAHAWLCARGFAATNILAYGESLGGAVAAELALRERVGGLVLQSTFTSVPDIGAELFPWLPARTVAMFRYDTRRKLPRVNVPVLVMHSRGDSLVAFHHAEENFAAAREPKLLWELQGDHNDSPQFQRERFQEGLRKFLTLLPAVKPNPAHP